jgi:hypothetical protein
MKSILSGRTKAVVISSAVAGTAAVGMALAMPATAANSYNIMLTDLPSDSASVKVYVGASYTDPNAVSKCVKLDGQQQVDAQMQVAAGQVVSAETFSNDNCDPSAGTAVGSSRNGEPVPDNLGTPNYTYKVLPVASGGDASGGDMP